MKSKRNPMVIFLITFVVLFPVILVSVGLFEKYRATRPRIPNTEMQGIEIDKKKYPITGIDISKHTGKVDFKKAKEEKMDFVYLKASEGISLVDKQLENYYKSAKEQALPVGFYHFFIFGTDGEKQADNFIHSIADKKTDLPYVIDVEDYMNVTSTPRKEVIQGIKSFISRLEEKGYKDIMIYTNESGYTTYIKGNFDSYKLWICSFRNQPSAPNWSFWQHSHIGKFNWAQGWVDINTFNGNKEEFTRFLNR